jgi:probable F420-dependent oxidoreductase
MRRAVLRAEELDYDIAYTWDHFFPLYGAADGPHLECWTLLAAWADATERIELGPLVSCVSYRNPQLLADMARTVDQISDGRLILGLGAGWFERDYDEYGYTFGTIGSRLTGLADALPAIGARFDVLNPPPVRRPPILIGGTGERRTLRLVAEHADGWHAGFPDRPAELEPKVAALVAWCEAIGRDPADTEWGVGVEPDDLERFLAVDADTYVEMGFRQFTLGFNGPTWSVDRGSPWLGWRDRRNAAFPEAARAVATR